MREIFEPGRGQRVPIRVWARALAHETVRQLQRLASQPYVVEFVAAMADAHVAEGVAVGSVFATEHTLVPRALGGDLGCGMSAWRITDAPEHLDRRVMGDVVRALGARIPAGDALHRGPCAEVPEEVFAAPLSTRALDHARERLAPRHLGTLGGGNHFLEIDRDAEGALWLLVHSGSRGLGAAIAEHHARATGSRASDALTGLDVGDASGAAYLADVAWALDFARMNRRALAARALEVLGEFLDLAPEERVDIHHNFVARERWLGRDLLVHRKGAVSVPAGTMALIPGSMGTASYLALGLGNADSLASCSHGAGRVMSRKEARAAVRPRALAEAMRRVAYPEHLAARLVEEAPAVYRDIGEVMEDQADLVKRVTRLTPLAVLKG